MLQHLHRHPHFRTELAARQLTRNSREWASEVLVINPTPQEVRAALARQVAERIYAAMEASLERQARFDETSRYFSAPGGSVGGGRYRG